MDMRAAPLLGMSCLLAASCTRVAEEDKHVDVTVETGGGDTETDTDTDADTDTDTDTDSDTFDCPDEDIGSTVPATWTGTTLDAGDDLAGPCGGQGFADRILQFTAPEAGDYLFDTIGSDYDALLYVLDGCEGAALACDDDTAGNLQARVRLGLSAGQTIALVIDGYSAAGDYVLNLQHPPALETSCEDDLDEDLDGYIDCMDDDCAAATSCAFACPDDSFATAPITLTGNLVGRPDEQDSYCSSTYAPTPDYSYLFTAPADDRYLFQIDPDETDFGAVLSLQSVCTGSEYTCTNSYWGDVLWLDLVAGESILVVAESIFGDAGDYAFDVSIAEPEDCLDLIDNNYDGQIDCADLQCDVDLNCTEICDDGADNDEDLRIDCFDSFCGADPLCDISCPEQELLGPLPITVTGSTLGLGNEWSSYCNVSLASDIAYRFTAPAAGTYTFDTFGSSFDTLLTIFDGCEGNEIECSDDYSYDDLSSLVQVTLGEGEEIIVVVDGYEEESGDYTLTVQ